MYVKNIQSILGFITRVLVGLGVASLASAQAIIPRAPDVAATSYVLLDAKTGHIIVE